MKSKLITSLLLASSLLATPSFPDQPGAPSAQDDGWTVGSLEEAGFDLEKMGALTEKLRANGHRNAHMVLVEYDGKLVYEIYLEGEDQNWGNDIGHVKFDHDVLHDLRSISKSVTALLLGIALERELGDDFDSALMTPVTKYFPNYSNSFTPAHEKITLENVLTMTDGLSWNEMEVPYSNRKNDEIQMYYTADPIKYVLRKPVRTEPGTAWYYNGGTTMVVAGVTEKLVGNAFSVFANEALFSPLGITDYYWHGLSHWPSGLPSAASGLRMRGRDLAKIGSLMLHDGQWNGTQVVPAEWVRMSSARHTEQTNTRWSKGGVYGYGYQWWHGNFGPRWDNVTAIAGTGYGGQKLFAIPEKRLAVTIFGGNYGKGNWSMPEDILAEIIAAAP